LTVANLTRLICELTVANLTLDTSAVQKNKFAYVKYITNEGK